MDAELLELQRQFESLQQAKSSTRLSERNIVELIHKLQERGFLDSDLLHTLSGKEFITPDRLRIEMAAEINKSGRVSLIDLSDVIGVDLYHVERLGQRIVADDPTLMLINGEIVSQLYWDGTAEEINERLQECSQISLAELAAQLHVGSELLVSILEPRLGSIVKGRLEGGQLYTPAYVSRISSMVCGAARGITVPTNLTNLWSSLQKLLQEVDGANGVSVDGALLLSLFNGMMKEGVIVGTLRAGVQWTPAVFANAQRESVESFFSQNSFITYDVLHKLAIPRPEQYLQSRYPDGIALDGSFVHPSMVDMLDAAIEDAVEHGNWIDCVSLLPSFVSIQDASKILSVCPYVQRAIKSLKATILGDSFVVSNIYIKDLFDRLEKDMDTLSYCSPGPSQWPYEGVHAEPKCGKNASQSEIKEASDDVDSRSYGSEKGTKKKRGKHIGPSKAAALENDPGNHDVISSKPKKNQRKTKDTNPSDASYTKSNIKKGLNKHKDDGFNIPSEEWTTKKILSVAPDLGELGDDPRSLVTHMSLHLRPMLVDTWKKRRNTMLVENAEKRRRLLDSLQKQLDEAFLDLQLYEKSLDLFDDDPSTSVILHKHLLRTMAASIADKLLLALVMDNRLMNGMAVDDFHDEESRVLSSADRLSLAEDLPSSLAVKAQSLVEALEGKRIDAFITALRALSEESGLQLKNLEKKLERTLLHSYRKELIVQVSSEADPVALFPKVVALLYFQVYNKAFQAPGRAIYAAVSRLKDKLPDAACRILTEYHSAIVTLLALQSALPEDVSGDDCSSDRILNKREFLEMKMPELKGLVISSTSQA